MSAASPFDLSGRRALVTGSSRGIGAGIAEALARAGAGVALNGRDPERTEAARVALAAKLTADGVDPDLHVVSFDVSDREPLRVRVS